MSTYNRERYLRNRAERIRKQRVYYEAHRAERLAYLRAWRVAHPGQDASASRAYRLSHLEVLRAYDRTRPARPGAYERTKRWVQRHPAWLSARLARQRAQRANAQGSHTAAEWQALVKSFDGRCGYCGQQRPLTRDHRVPLSRHGSDNIDNIIPACRSCNSRKKTKTEVEFRAVVT